MMTSRERIRTALAHAQPDHTPCGYYATPEIHQALLEYFGLRAEADRGVAMGGSFNAVGDSGVAERLGSDIRYVH